jgi:hypothetical protein
MLQLLPDQESRRLRRRRRLRDLRPFAGEAAARAAPVRLGGKYRIEAAGGRNSRLDELQAALLCVRLPRLEAANARRRAIAVRYAARIRQPAVALPGPAGDDDVVHLYVVRSPFRDRLAAHLRARGIGCDVHYGPHLAAALRLATIGLSDRLFGDVVAALYRSWRGSQVATNRSSAEDCVRSMRDRSGAHGSGAGLVEAVAGIAATPGRAGVFVDDGSPDRSRSGCTLLPDAASHPRCCCCRAISLFAVIRAGLKAIDADSTR